MRVNPPRAKRRESPLSSALKYVVAGGFASQNNFALGLQASLTRSPAKLAHSILLRFARSTSESQSSTGKNKRESVGLSLIFGRSGGTRTRGLQYPKLARYHLRYTSLLNSINISQINKKVNSFFKKIEQAHKRLLILFKQLFT